MSFAAIQGQDTVLRRLRRLLESRHVPPALLFYGPAGVGKCTTAVELAKALHCAAPKTDLGSCDACAGCSAADKGIDPDVKVLNAAYQAGLLGEEVEKQAHLKIDAVRHLIKDIEMRSMAGRWKAAIIEDAHRMLPEAQNALLKALEEPPPRTLWILVTSQRERLLPTVLSRCHAYSFRSLPPSVAEPILRSRGIPDRDAKRLARASEGSPGRSLELWRRRDSVPDPDAWIDDRLAPFRLAEQLPRELHLARPVADSHLDGMAWHARLRFGDAAPGRLRKALAELAALRRALKSNADPRLAVELGALELQDLLHARRPSPS